MLSLIWPENFLCVGDTVSWPNLRYTTGLGSHLRHVKTSCIKAMSLLRVVGHTSWGADRQTHLLLYKSLILPKLEYGCEIYSAATKSRLRTLDAVHHAGVRQVTGALKSCPIPS